MSLFDDAKIVYTPNGYKAGKLYAVKGDDLTVTRATSATRVNASGVIETVAANVPRLDYTNGTCPSVLVEPQRTNLQIQSEDFTNAVYIKVGSTITTNATTAPDGTATADKLVESATTGLHTALILAQQPTVSDYTVSVFVKASGRTKFEISEGFSVGGNIKFDLTAETFTTTAPAKNGKIEKFANGWYRCSATWPNLTGVNTQILLSTLNNSNASSYTGDGTSGVFLWGTQIELGSNSSSYIKTTSTTVTRNADVITDSTITGITTLTTTFEDNTTQVLTSPTSYTMPIGRIKSVVGI